MREMMLFLLMPHYQTAVHEYGQSALWLLQQGRPIDLLLVDSLVRDIPLLKLLSACRELSPATKLVVIAHDKNISLRNRCFEAGATHFLLKPDISGAGLFRDILQEEKSL